MRRPYRTVRRRLARRTVAHGRRLPAETRHRLRQAADAVYQRRLRRHTPSGAPEIVTGFDHWRTLAGIAGTLVETLSRAGVEVVRLERDDTIVLAVAEESRDAALTALANDPATSGWYAGGPSGRPKPLTASAPDGADLRVFRWLTAPDGTPLTDTTFGVRLQFWRTAARQARRPDGGTHTPGTRLAPTVNPVASYITPALWQEAQADPGRRLRPQAPPHLLSLTEPVDIVYTWVDDADPAWQRRRDGVGPAATLSSDALHAGRTRNRDELRYSLRSLTMYASWYRRIWLVTDGQVPTWLADDPRLTVVSHHEIFTDPAVLPTFNSHAIESQLHHIEGLSEHFLYLNDDVFFGRPVRPELFFAAPGITRFCLAPIAIDRQLVPQRLNGAIFAARNNRDLLAADVGRTVTNRMQHTPHAHLRSSLTDLEASHPDLVAQVAGSRFRDANDLSIASELGHYWAYAHGQAVTTTLAFRYVDIGSPRMPEYLDSLLARRDQDCFCINDAGPYPQPPDDARVADFLARYFPVASPFERTPA